MIIVYGLFFLFMKGNNFIVLTLILFFLKRDGNDGKTYFGENDSFSGVIFKS